MGEIYYDEIVEAVLMPEETSPDSPRHLSRGARRVALAECIRSKNAVETAIDLSKDRTITWQASANQHRFPHWQ